jgi:hypothetical protein
MRLEASCAAGAAMLWTIALAAGAVEPVSARPEFLVRYQADAMRKPTVDGCAACHVKPDGGGARNEFGTAFDAANREITPLLRAAFPSHFDFPSVRLADGSVFSFADPQSRVVVVERDGQKAVVTIADLTSPKEAPLPPPANRMTFFVSSQGVANGGHLGGLAGGDRHCQTLAAAAGAGDRTWRAYLSTSFKGATAANAGDRIGGGPWHNARGVRVAGGVLDLHARERLPADLLLTEKGDGVDAATMIFTGTQPSGLAAADRSCANWTSTSGEALAGAAGGSWNSAGPVSCAPGAAAPRLYCFAVK